MYELKIYKGVMSHDNEEWCKIWKGIDLSVQNWHEELAEFWPKRSKNLKNLHFNGMRLTKVYNVWAKKVQRSYVWWHWRLMQNLKENWLVVWKMTWCRLKNDDFILESKMAELNQNINTKQPDQPDAAWKLYFTLEINE